MITVSKLKSKLHRVKWAIKRVSIKKYFLNVQHKNVYKVVNKELDIFRNKQKIKNKTVIVVHLYYVESWKAIRDKLLTIKAFSYDVVVSLPVQNTGFKGEILNDFPNAFIFQSPNRGRDVLSFTSIALTLYDMGYEYVLKIHSKKSTHRTDGKDWFNSIITALIPISIKDQKSLYAYLEDPRTAIIGPAAQYTSLKVNFEANGMYMTKLVKRIYNKRIAFKILQTEREAYGFFAGTMMWLRLDAIMPLIKKVNITSYDLENGQIDGTYAHAIERLLCVIPEINNKNIYEIDGKEVQEVKYNQGVVPDWSKVYIGPQQK